MVRVKPKRREFTEGHAVENRTDKPLDVVVVKSGRKSYVIRIHEAADTGLEEYAER